MQITSAQLAAIYQIKIAIAEKWIEAINETLEKYEINTRQRVSAFLAQIGHESGRLRYVKEIWGPTDVQLRYEGRKDLGNYIAGDGSKYRGRGLIQITGRANYTQVSKDIGIDFVQAPELLETEKYAVESAAWFWNSRRLNDHADKQLFTEITKRINGGTNGIADRVEIYNRALSILK
jgi:putative chitinase